MFLINSLLNKIKFYVINKYSSDYNLIHAARASKLLNIQGKKCLVVGCNTGKDCSYFIRFGAKEVGGLDVIDEIGKEFSHPKVKYFKLSAEKMNKIKNNYYDLVYCHATMEHIKNVKSAFKEIVRVTKRGGFIYSIAAPLWNSRNGHHKSDIFDTYPWIHLRLSRRQILKYCKKNKIKDTINNTAIRHHVDYMLNPLYFNKRFAREYIQVCNQLKGVKIINNHLDMDDSKYLTNSIYKELSKKGYTRRELLSVVHTFIAQKR